MGNEKILYESIGNNWKSFLNEAAKYADLYGDGVAIGTSEYGIYAIEMNTKRGHFSMTDSTYEVITQEGIKEMERDTIEYEADYYWDEVFAQGENIESNYSGEEWGDIPKGEQKHLIETMIDIVVDSKMDSMRGEFDYEFNGKSEEFHLDMVGGGQGGMDDLDKPIIPKKDAQVLKMAWDKLHLGKEKDFDSGELALMKKAIDIYEKLKKNDQKLLEKSLQLWWIGNKGKGGKAIEKMMKKNGYKTGKLKPGELK